jgi:hypothetical protein
MKKLNIVMLGLALLQVVTSFHAGYRNPSLAMDESPRRPALKAVDPLEQKVQAYRECLQDKKASQAYPDLRKQKGSSTEIKSISQLVSNNDDPLSSSCITRLPEDWSSDEQATTEETFLEEEKSKNSKDSCCWLEGIFCNGQKSNTAIQRSTSMPGIRTEQAKYRQPPARSFTRELAFNITATFEVDSRADSSSSFATIPPYLTRSPSSSPSIQSFATIPPNELSSDNDRQSIGKSVIFL